MNRFDDKVKELRGDVLRAADVAILQVNIGYRCNMACKHCHLSAGPRRTESMDMETIAHVLRVLKESGIRTVDITGGAPELNPHLWHLIAEARNVGANVIVRTNLTVLLEPGWRTSRNSIAIVASR